MFSLVAAVRTLQLLAAATGPPVSDDVVAVNLDRDPPEEQLLYHERPSDQRVQVQVRDFCRRASRTWHLSPYENKFNAIDAIEADTTTPQPEVSLSATGPSPALTDRVVKLVRFDQREETDRYVALQPDRWPADAHRRTCRVFDDRRFSPAV